MGWPCKYDILIEVETEKLPQIFSSLSFQKVTFSKREGKKKKIIGIGTRTIRFTIKFHRALVFTL